MPRPIGLLEHSMYILSLFVFYVELFSNLFFHAIIFSSGYMSPEYAVHGQYSIKSDVFSFGVLILEMVSGKKNRGFSHPEHHHNLLGHVSKKNSILLNYVAKLNFLLILMLF